jgi:hypothetical protein
LLQNLLDLLKSISLSTKFKEHGLGYLAKRYRSPIFWSRQGRYWFDSPGAKMGRLLRRKLDSRSVSRGIWR